MDQLLPAAGQVAVVDGDTRSDRVHEHGRGHRVELHPREAIDGSRAHTRSPRSQSRRSIARLARSARAKNA